MTPRGPTLLAGGPDPLAESNDGRTSLHSALRYAVVRDVISALVQGGGAANPTSLELAALESDAAALTSLLAGGIGSRRGRRLGLGPAALRGFPRQSRARVGSPRCRSRPERAERRRIDRLSSGGPTSHVNRGGRPPRRRGGSQRGSRRGRSSRDAPSTQRPSGTTILRSFSHFWTGARTRQRGTRTGGVSIFACRSWIFAPTAASRLSLALTYRLNSSHLDLYWTQETRKNE